MTDDVLTHAGPDELATAVAERLVARLAEVQAGGDVPSVVLTGGSVAIKIHEAVATASRESRVDWSRVDVWFGDERFVAADSPDRNAGQAAEAMLDHLPLDPARVHVMPPSDGAYGEDVDAAAAAYAADLAAAGDGTEGPAFDVLMLGIGPDGHCASLFPGRDEQSSPELAVAVRDSPKPPPTRISMTLRTLSGAREVWFVASGEEKARAVRDAVTGDDPIAVPAAGPKGLERTLWLLDAAAGSLLP